METSRCAINFPSSKFLHTSFLSLLTSNMQECTNILGCWPSQNIFDHTVTTRRYIPTYAYREYGRSYPSSSTCPSSTTGKIAWTTPKIPVTMIDSSHSTFLGTNMERLSCSEPLLIPVKRLHRRLKSTSLQYLARSASAASPLLVIQRRDLAQSTIRRPMTTRRCGRVQRGSLHAVPAARNALHPKPRPSRQKRKKTRRTMKNQNQSQKKKRKRKKKAKKKCLLRSQREVAGAGEEAELARGDEEADEVEKAPALRVKNYTLYK